MIEEDLSSDCGQSVTRSVLYTAKRIKDKILVHDFSPPWIQRYTEQLLLRAAKVFKICADVRQLGRYKATSQSVVTECKLTATNRTLNVVNIKGLRLIMMISPVS